MGWGVGDRVWGLGDGDGGWGLGDGGWGLGDGGWGIWGGIGVGGEREMERGGERERERALVVSPFDDFFGIFLFQRFIFLYLFIYFQK